MNMKHTASACEDRLTGHVHAIQLVLSIAARREAVWQALWPIVESELEVVDGKPPAAVSEHNAAVWEQTYGRRDLVQKAQQTMQANQ